MVGNYYLIFTYGFFTPFIIGLESYYSKFIFWFSTPRLFVIFLYDFSAGICLT